MDNASTIKLAKNPEFHKRSTHIEVKYHFIREKYCDGTLKIEHVRSEHKIADVMTKPLNRVKFNSMRDMIVEWQKQKHFSYKIYFKRKY